ncbi:RDD family protein [Flavobacterium cerinum]|uniref:RDD family protein n=1 Tax=Flavobacterium cerinum TaxID=2502784 RepID=A0A444GS62_9FLAO|nr:RDD family protein [Flavobacterium cerinum]RWW93779.1 RDD family protein [Flavobacterium cerinum]
MEKPVEIKPGMLASRTNRFVNFIIDSIVVGLIQFGATEGCNALYHKFGNEALNIGLPVLGNIKYLLLATALNIVYFGLFETLTMRTPGKYVTNTMVVKDDGTKPGDGRIFLRTLCRLIPLEFLSFLWNPGVGLHDSLSRTRVVDIYEFNRRHQTKDVEDIGINEEK